MAISTYQTYLMYGTTVNNVTTYSKLCDIKDYPDLIGQPEQIEVTTLSDPEREYIPGIRSNDQKTFTANYDPTDFSTIAALTGEMPLAIWFGANIVGTTVTPDGHDGKLEGKGKVSLGIPGAGVNDPTNMQVICTMSKGFERVS